MQSKISQLGKTVLALVLVAVMALAFSHSAQAAPNATPQFYVETTAENITADSVITLREALLIARNGTENGTGLGRPLTDGEKNKLYNCSFTGYEPDHLWIDGGCGSQNAETIYYISGNTIAYNGNNGILVLSGIHNNFYNNSFHDNYLLAVDLGNDGVTPNDNNAMDADTGANNLQNYPTLKSANAATKTVSGKLVSTPNTSFQIDLFKSAGCDASGYGEGTTRLGFVTVNTNAQGVANFSTVLKFKHGNAITAVASGSEGTSEFSKCVIAQ